MISEASATPGRVLSSVLRDNIKKYRLIRDLSQADMADAMQTFGFDWKQSTVGFVEGGRRQTKVDELPALAMVLQATIPELLDPSGPDKMNAEPLLHSREPIRAMDPMPASWWIRGRCRIGLEKGDKFALSVSTTDAGELSHTYRMVTDPTLSDLTGGMGRTIFGGPDG